MNVSETKEVDSAELEELINHAPISEITPVNIPTENHIDSVLKKELGSSQVSESSSSIALATTVSTYTKSNESPPSSKANLDNPKPLDPASFPDQPRNGFSQLPATIANTLHLTSGYNIKVQYDVIRKKLYIIIPSNTGTPDNADNVAMARIISLANLNGLPIGQLPSFLEVIGDRNQYNPVAEWIKSKPWDNTNRLNDLFATLTQRSDFPEELKNKLIYRWQSSAVAAALLPSGFKARGVLTLQGPQSIGKTSWISSLIPDPILREGVLKLDHHLDAGNKDSLISAITHWIVEVGELDSSFRKDIARLKGFLTSDRDKVRRPYGRSDSEYPRRTVFCATVNDDNFLVDSTGNSRWWTIPVTAVNYNHGIDMQQVYAQLATHLEDGMKWWLTPEEEELLELHNKKHRAVSVIRERILDTLDLDRINESGLSAMTATQLLQTIDIKSPTNAQSKECASILRELLGEHKRINGSNKWRIPFKKEEWASSNAPLVSDDGDVF
ncbi:MAG: VapE family protein [Methylotenera sp.]|nr:VapE family protein [Methylotenera sp.]MDO9389154.1 VapE family protein [Methylotenera sp.]